MATASNLTIVDTKVESFEMSNDFSALKNHDQSNIKVSVDTSFDDISDDDNITVKLNLSIDINIITPDEEVLMAMKLHQISIFRYENTDLNAEEAINDFGLNMISISYPYARSFVSGVSALAGVEPVELPTINVLNLVGNNSDEL